MTVTVWVAATASGALVALGVGAASARRHARPVFRPAVGASDARDPARHGWPRRSGARTGLLACLRGGEPAPRSLPTAGQDALPHPSALVVVSGAVLLAAVGVVGPVVSAVLAVGAVGVRAQVVRTRRARHRSRQAAAVPELVDLFVIAASAGHPVPRCLDVVAGRAPPAVRGLVREARHRVRSGEPVDLALGALGRELGPLGATLTDALRGGMRTGAPLGPALTAVSAAARDHRRRSAEEAARRLPITMLFPLVGCILPAFALLAVVPLLAGSLGSLDP